MKNRYAILTVDTEALPNRAEADHVKRLILGIHGGEEAGVKEMAIIGAEFNAPLVFFLDMCGAFSYKTELAETARWLMNHGQDVQLHAHPEYLPLSFWRDHDMSPKPAYLNNYPDDRAEFILTYFASLLESWTGKKPTAFRAGSFRWNGGTLRAMKKLGIEFSFNNSMCAVHNKQCAYSLPTNDPFRWSNGIIEIPMSEYEILPALQHGWWARLQFPQSRFFRHRAKFLNFLPGSARNSQKLLVFLIHSWSFLYRNDKGYEIYRDSRLLSGFRKFLRRLSLDRDIIVSTDLPDLIARNEIPVTHVENVDNADVQSGKKN